MEQRITFELRNSKNSEVGPQAAAQVFASIPQLGSVSWLPFSSPEPISFEIYCVNQIVTFQISLPPETEHYVKSQITATYPEIVINEVPREYAFFHHLLKGQTATGSLSLTHGSFYPLQTYLDFSQTDPLSAILGFFSKLSLNQAALVQVLVAYSSDSWKQKGYSLAQGSVNSDGTITPHPYKTQIERKLNQVCHRVAIKLATSSESLSESQILLKNLAGTFAPLRSAQGNVLSLKQPKLFKKKFLYSLAYRDFSGSPKQYFSVDELATMYHLPYKEVKDIKNIAWGKTLLGEPPEDLPTHTHSPEEQLDSLNLFAKTEYKNEEQIFGIKDDDRRRHMYVVGKSGTGKSTLLANMIINDLKKGKGVAVIDPHGDLVETVLNYIPSNRINDVVYLNPADPQYTVRMNLLEDSGQQHKELIASGIIAIFQKLYAYSWGPRLEHILRNTLLTLVEKDQSTMEDIVRILTNEKFRERTVEKLQDPVLKNFWIDEFANMGDKLRAEAVSPILNKIGQFVTSPMIRNVINYPSSSFSLKEVMDGKKILLANLSQGKLGEDNAALLGAMLITKIQLTAMDRVYQAEEDRQDFYLYVDEFQNFATTSFIKILSESRKYRLSLCLANQYIDQVDEPVRKAIFGNAASLVTFLVGAQDASLLSAEFGQQYTPEDLVSIGRHQIVLKLCVDGTTSAPFPAWTLPLATSSNQNKEKVIKVSNERYAKPKSNNPVDLQIPTQPKNTMSDHPEPTQDSDTQTNIETKKALPQGKQELELPAPDPVLQLENHQLDPQLPQPEEIERLNAPQSTQRLSEGDKQAQIDELRTKIQNSSN